MSARHRRAARAIAALPEVERQALKAAARAALKSADKALPQAVCLDQADRRLSAMTAREVVSQAKAERRAAERREVSQSQAWADRDSESDTVSAAWDCLGRLLEVAGRQAYAMLPLYLRRIAIAAPRVSNWLTSASLSHHYHWVSRAVRRTAGERQRQAGRMREYPLGYASARGAWRYRAGCERSAVAGYTGRVSVEVVTSEVTAFVDPAVQAAAVRFGVSPAAAVKWTQVDARMHPVLTERRERIDYSLAASGINTGKGYSHERHGKAYDPRGFAGKIAYLAAHAPKFLDDRQRREAIRQYRQAAERRDTERMAAAARQAIAARGRLITE
jgi:hypothetical protein